MYPYDVSEVIFVELIANALDSGADRIYIEWDDDNKVLIITDNGSGMTEKQFEEYHDFAAELKIRGEGIGFAGVGAKISFNIADRVITETFSTSFKGGSDWYLKSDKNLNWEDIKSKKLSSYGTRVEVHFKNNSDISHMNLRFFEDTLFRHYITLLDDTFLRYYTIKIYPKGVKFYFNGNKKETNNIENLLELELFSKYYPTKSGKKSDMECLVCLKKSIRLATICVEYCFALMEK